MKYYYKKNINTTQLRQEILTALFPDCGINCLEDNVEIIFQTELTAGQKGTLDTIVTNHTPDL